MFGIAGRVLAGAGGERNPSGPTAAAIIRSDSNQVSNSGGGDIVITKPSGTVEGDLLVASIGADSFPTIGVPAGWTALSQVSQTNTKHIVYWKEAGASEPASYTWTISSGDSAGGMMRIDGHKAGDPIDVHNTNQGSGGSVVAPAVTGSTDFSLRLRFATNVEGSRVDGNLWGGYGTGAVSNAAQKDSSTLSTIGTYTFGGDTGSDWGAHTVVIMPDGG